MTQHFLEDLFSCQLGRHLEAQDINLMWDAWKQDLKKNLAIEKPLSNNESKSAEERIFYKLKNFPLRGASSQRILERSRGAEHAATSFL